jgi:hypothetical protein
LYTTGPTEHPAPGRDVRLPQRPIHHERKSPRAVRRRCGRRGGRGRPLECGKSSAINAITHRKGLAKTSKRPGATRLINFFELEPGRRLVDLPGYGYAAVAGEMRRHWGVLIDAYFGSRQSLRGVIVVMDIRHPLKEHDVAMLELASARSVPVHVLLTKADKLGRRRDLGRGCAGASLARIGCDRPGVFGDVRGGARGGPRSACRLAVRAHRTGAAKKETPVGPAEPTGED